MKPKHFANPISYVVLIGGGLLCLFLWSQSQSVDLEAYRRYRDRLRQVQVADFEINQTVLQVKSGMLMDENPIADQLTDLATLQTELRQRADAINQAQREELQPLLEDYFTSWQRKAQLIQQFQSQNSVLNNALAAFPVALANLTEPPNSDPLLTTRLHRLLRNLLTFNLQPNNYLASLMQQEMRQILALPPPNQKGDLKAAIVYAKSVLNSRPQVNHLARAIITSPTTNHLNILVRVDDQNYQSARDQVSYYYLAFWVMFTLWLLGVMMLLIMQLRLAKSPLHHDSK